MTTPSSKLRRLTFSAAAGEVSPDWASLNGDLVELIGWRVLAGDLHDYVRFRAVCSHWRTTTTTPHGRGVADRRLHPRRSHLPLLDGHVILDSVDGLLLLHRDVDTAIRILHPFTGDVVEFPPLVSLLPQMKSLNCSLLNKYSRLFKVCTSIAVSSTTGAITAMLALDLAYRVAYATAGDRRWALSDWEFKPMLKPVSFQGKIYSLQFAFGEIRKVYIYQFNPPCPDVDGGPSQLPLPEKIAACPMDKFRHPLYFVECGSELLLVAYNDASYSKLLVYRVADIVRGKFEPMTSIGDHTLLVLSNTT
nr:unnamed protein product [Digitaria exilis]